MGFEPLEDTLPLPQIVRAMKSIIVPSNGRSCTVDHNDSSNNVDGGGQPSSQARGQEEGVAGSTECSEICERSDRDRVWNEVEYLLGSLERTKAMLLDGTDWDPDEVKWINERYRLCKRQALDYVLKLNLEEILLTVTFPGEHLSYLQVAQRVVKDCSRWELETAIREIGLHPYERVYFKADDSRPPLEQLEQLLLTMMGDADYVLAGEFNRKLNLESHTASYKAIKADLTGNGWIWKTKRIGGKVTKIISR
jgi:hypothetical protein